MKVNRSNDSLSYSVGMTASHLSLQIIDFQCFINTYLNQIPIWTLDVQKQLQNVNFTRFLLK